MVYISPRGMKLMRVIHIVAAQIWVGAVICIFGFALYCFNNTAVEQFLVLAPMMCVQAWGLGGTKRKRLASHGWLRRKLLSSFAHAKLEA